MAEDTVIADPVTATADRLKALSKAMTTKAAIAQTPKELVWTLNKAKLYRYVPVLPKEKRHPIPLLLVFALMNRPYILDLRRGHSFVEHRFLDRFAEWSRHRHVAIEHRARGLRVGFAVDHINHGLAPGVHIEVARRPPGFHRIKPLTIVGWVLGHFTKTLALEMARFNITANAIAPGFTSTEMVDAIPEEIAAQIKAKIPLGRFALPEEIAKAAAFLAADGDYITGQELNVNGGYHM
jgi:hypothetical protein